MLIRAALALMMSVAFGAENFISIPTELRISTLKVSIRAPLGLQYRPGELFPLEIHVENPGAAMKAELFASEGAPGGSIDEWAERVVLPSMTLPQGKSRFTLPLRAPSVSAGITLVIRGESEGSGHAELFRASLSRILNPLPSGGRIILVCGAGAAPRARADQTTPIAARDLFSEGWMWESVDWLLLNDDSIKDAPPTAQDALRAWLSGGGRLFIGSRESLAAAVKLRLLPVSSSSDVRSEIKWWEENAGMKPDDVLVSKNFRPVYARLRVGFGQIVFLFPGSDASGVDGAALFNRPDLQRVRPALPDTRIQPDRFYAFVPAAASPRRLRSIMVWSGAGALILCAALLYAHASKSKIEVAALPLGAAALLTALITNGFPRPELLVSRIHCERSARDGARVEEEWALVESFRQPIQTSAAGPAHGTLAPRFDEVEDLRQARLERSDNNGRVSLSGIIAAPNLPVMLYSREEHASDPQTPPVNGVSIPIVGRQDFPRVEIGGELNALHAAVLVNRDKEVSLLRRPALNQPFSADAYNPQMFERFLAEQSGAAVAKARAVAIKWAIDEAVSRAGGNGEGTFIYWKDTLANNSSLISIEGATESSSTEFFIRSVNTK